MGVHGFDSIRMVYIHADKVGTSLNTYKTINGKSKSDRVEEGGAILRSIFTADVAMAA